MIKNDGLPMISCIIPVHNTGKVLERTLRSIVKQVYRNIEIICIDDASTDNSGAILRKFQNSDNRIIILEQKESVGAAVCRNKGLDIAKGKYVIFLDSDDFFYPNMLQVALDLIEKQNADVAMFGYLRIQLDENGEMILEAKKVVYQNTVIEGGECFAEILRDVNVSPWNKLVKRELLNKSDIKFQNLPNCNDVYYSLATLFCADRIAFCNEILMEYYVGRIGCLSNVREKKEHFTVEAFTEVYEFLVNHMFSEKTISKFINYVIYQLLSIIASEQYTLEVKRFVIKHFKESHLLTNINDRMDQDDSFQYINKMMLQDIISDKVRSMYEYLAQAVRDIVQKANKVHMEVALWGCGQRGKKLLDTLKSSQIKITYVIDMAKEIQNTYYDEYLICDYSEIKEECIILVTNPKFLEEIQQIAKNRIVIDLYSYCDKNLDKQIAEKLYES